MLEQQRLSHWAFLTQIQDKNVNDDSSYNFRLSPFALIKTPCVLSKRYKNQFISMPINVDFWGKIIKFRLLEWKFPVSMEHENHPKN